MGTIKLVLIIILVGAFGALATTAMLYRSNAIQAEAERDKIEVEKKKVESERDLAIEANKKQEEAIGRLKATAAANDKLLARLVNQVEEINNNTAETQKAIGDLKDENEGVRDFLSIPVPPDLWLQLNR